MINQYYQQALKDPQFHADPVQASVVKKLQLSFDVIESNHMPSILPASIYLWGKVGRGKSCLMDAFYHCLSIPQKRRVHFYRFMREVHQQLAVHQSQCDPLIDIAKQTRGLCIDEFFVSDIGDAMLLSGLILQLFKQGVVIVATSNVEPARLYENGLQRQRFLPAIVAIEANMQIIEMAGQDDHRLRHLTQSEAYFIQPPDAMADRMRSHFIAHCNDDYQGPLDVEIEHRQIRCEYQAGQTIWFEFEQLCKGPRSQNDYIALASARPETLSH
ncbi:MAG: cell division protein ZapE [Alteromonadaceae bacterium]